MRYGGPFRHTVVNIFQCWACIIRPSVNWSILVVEGNQASSASYHHFRSSPEPSGNAGFRSFRISILYLFRLADCQHQFRILQPTLGVLRLGGHKAFERL